jgi:hypothetical protein
MAYAHKSVHYALAFVHVPVMARGRRSQSGSATLLVTIDRGRTARRIGDLVKWLNGQAVPPGGLRRFQATDIVEISYFDARDVPSD